MNNLLFTGEFNKLKSFGYKFQKLFAANYKCYHKQEKNYSLWVWVGAGGYIELNDYYSNTKKIVDAMRSIKWDDVELKDSLVFDKYKRVYIRFNHSDDVPVFITDTSMSVETFVLLHKTYGKDYTGEQYNECHVKVRSIHDRELFLTEDTCMQILREIDTINLV